MIPAFSQILNQQCPPVLRLTLLSPLRCTCARLSSGASRETSGSSPSSGCGTAPLRTAGKTWLTLRSPSRNDWLDHSQGGVRARGGRAGAPQGPPPGPRAGRVSARGATLRRPGVLGAGRPESVPAGAHLRYRLAATHQGQDAQVRWDTKFRILWRGIWIMSIICDIALCVRTVFFFFNCFATYRLTKYNCRHWI